MPHSSLLPAIFAAALLHWLTRRGAAAARRRSTQALVARGLIHHVVDEHGFEDDDLFYRFRCDEAA